MRMRQVVGGVWGVLIQVVGVGKWAFLAISGLGGLEKLKHCQKPLKNHSNPTHPTHFAINHNSRFQCHAKTTPIRKRQREIRQFRAMATFPRSFFV